MDNTHLNVRFFDWHLQILRDRFGVFIERNRWHRANGWPSGFFSVYNFFGYRP